MTVVRHAHPEIHLVSAVRGDDGRRQPCAVIECAGCCAVGRHWISGGRNYSSQHAGKAFQKLGWGLGTRPSCPACEIVKSNKARRDEPMSTKPALTIAAGAPRPLSPDEKRKVREILDGTFDEQKGFYLDGQSDQTIGIKLGIPWASIREFREFAYGPLKGNEETHGLRADIETLISDVERARVASEQSSRDALDQAAKLIERLNRLEAKMGLRA